VIRTKVQRLMYTYRVGRWPLYGSACCVGDPQKIRAGARAWRGIGRQLAYTAGCGVAYGGVTPQRAVPGSHREEIARTDFGTSTEHSSSTIWPL